MAVGSGTIRVGAIVYIYGSRSSSSSIFNLSSNAEMTPSKSLKEKVAARPHGCATTTKQCPQTSVSRAVAVVVRAPLARPAPALLVAARRVKGRLFIRGVGVRNGPP